MPAPKKLNGFCISLLYLISKRIIFKTKIRLRANPYSLTGFIFNIRPIPTQITANIIAISEAYVLVRLSLCIIANKTTKIFEQV